MENKLTNPAPLDGKTTAIISYLTPIGLIIAFIMNATTKNKLASFHIRQSLFLVLLAVAASFLNIILAFIPFLGWLTSLAISIGLLALWIMGIISAVNEEEKPLPVIGELAQKIFAGI